MSVVTVTWVCPSASCSSARTSAVAVPAPRFSRPFASIRAVWDEGSTSVTVAVPV